MTRALREGKLQKKSLGSGVITGIKRWPPTARKWGEAAAGNKGKLGKG